MKLIKAEEAKMQFEKVTVAVLSVGKGIEGKMRGKQVRQQYQSFDVQDARPEEVASIILKALEAASGRGK